MLIPHAQAYPHPIASPRSPLQKTPSSPFSLACIHNLSYGILSFISPFPLPFLLHLGLPKLTSNLGNAYHDSCLASFLSLQGILLHYSWSYPNHFKLLLLRGIPKCKLGCIILEFGQLFDKEGLPIALSWRAISITKLHLLLLTQRDSILLSGR